MSTRSSILYGEGVHFYQDLEDDDDGVYLELAKEYVEPGEAPGEVTVRIPAHIWEVMRTSHSSRLDLINLSDTDLQQLVGTEVDERIKDHQQAADDDVRAVRSFCGSGVYGPAESSREAQVEAGLSYYTNERTRQRKVRVRMGALKPCRGSR